MELFFEDTQTDRPPLVLIAGLATDSVSWILQKEALAQHFRLVTFDNRGVGRSPIPEGPYSVAEMSQDLLWLLDHLDVSRTHLVGHSLGGTIAQQFAKDHPERVDRMVLACSLSHLQGRSVPVLQSWVDLLSLGAEAEGMAHALLPWLYSEAFFATPGNLEAAVAAMKAHPFPMVYEGVKAQLAAIKTFDSRSYLSKLSNPTMVLAAECDLLVSNIASRKLAESIPGAVFDELPAAGHSCMLETPKAFNQTILKFLQA